MVEELGQRIRRTAVSVWFLSLVHFSDVVNDYVPKVSYDG